MDGKLILKRFFLTLLAGALFNCVNNGMDARDGGGSGTGNARTVIAGILVKPDGNTPAVCDIYLYPHDSIPSQAGTIGEMSIAGDRSDNAGLFIISGFQAGTYNLFCSDTSRTLSKLIFKKTIGRDDSLFIGTHTLTFQSAIAGTVTNTEGLPAIAFVSGSPFIATINDSSGFFRLENLPMQLGLPISFMTLPGTGPATCTSEYRLGQLPDTTIFVTVTLECH